MAQKKITKRGQLIQAFGLLVFVGSMIASRIVVMHGFKFGILLMIGGMMAFILMMIEGHEAR
jgi:hypothetical protein